ncbi:MAG: ABC transporter ATP-binding protein, partial [Prevotella sp.]|nr:ABC transporter ATP-binding protein [Prevotella sp.]
MFAKLRSILEIPDNKYTVRQISCWLWKALQGNRLQAVLNAGIGLLGVGLGLVSVWAMQRAIDTASGVRDGSILWAVGIMALLILGEFALGISRVWIRNILGVKAQNRMQQHILARLLRSEWRGREAMHSGDVINRLEDDVKTVVTFLTETLPSTLSTVAMFVGAFIYLFRMDIWLAVITVGILPLFISVSRIYMVYMRRYSRKVRDCDSLVQALLTETMQHRMLVKTMEADQQMLERLDTIQTTLHSWVRKRTIFSVGSNFFLNVGFSLGYLVAFLWGAFRLSAGTLTFGGMTAFLQLVSRIQG